MYQRLSCPGVIMRCSPNRETLLHEGLANVDTRTTISFRHCNILFLVAEVFTMFFLTCFNRGIKYDFPFICKVPREVLKTAGFAHGFQPSEGPCEC